MSTSTNVKQWKSSCRSRLSQLYVKEKLSFQQRFSIQRKKWYVMHLTLPWDLMEEASEHLANTEESRGKRRKASWREPIISRSNRTSDKQSMFQDNCCLLTAIWQTSKACPTPLSSRNSRSKPTSTPYTQPSCPSPSLILPCLRHNAICMCRSHRHSSNSFSLDGNHQTFRERRIHSSFPTSATWFITFPSIT